MTQTPTESHRAAALEVLRDLNLREVPNHRHLVSGHRSSLPIVADGDGGRTFLLKYYLPLAPDTVLPAGVRPDDYARREIGFYRLLDTIDPERREFPAPRTIVVGPGDPPRWLLLEWLPGAVGPTEEVIGQDHVFELMRRLAAIPTERLLGRRGFPLEHWDPVGYLDRIRHMYDAVLFVLGEARWRHVQRFFAEAVRWTDGRKQVLVHGDFTESNIVVTDEGSPFLVDFECIGLGNRDHDFAWFWIHSTRHHEWKRQLLARWFGELVGGDRIRSEWGIRSTLAYLAIRRLRWGYLMHGDEDPRQSPNLALLDAALEGGRELFPV
ncbi:MAG: aminoglycoside phosphotransferase family protein [Planctomycetes bacterium]|nr:aminoglycoside phosphotransferase family protein [Planctomycetota bacterium]